MKRMHIKSVLLLFFTFIIVISTVAGSGTTLIDSVLIELQRYDYGVDRSVPAAVDSLWKCSFANQGVLEKQLVNFLKNNKLSKAGTQFTVQLLSINGSRAVIPVLEEMLKQPSRYDAALYGLECHPSEIVNLILIRQCSKLKGDEQLGVIHVLGRRKVLQALPALHHLIQKNKKADTDVSIAAVHALGQIGSTESIPILDQALPDETTALKQVRLEALLCCLETLCISNPEAAAEKIRTIILAEGNTPLKIAGQRRLILLNEDPVRAITDIILKGDSLMAHEAISMFKEIPETCSLKPLHSALSSLRTSQFVQLLNILAGCHYPEFLSVVQTAMNHPDTQVRIAAIQSLVQPGNVCMVPVLLGTAIQNSREGATARAVLNQLPGKDVDRFILDLMKDTTLSVEKRIILIQTCGTRELGDARDLIVCHLSGNEDGLRLVSIQALEKTGTVNELQPLIDLYLKSNVQKELRATRETVQAIVRRNPGSGLAESHIIPAINQADEGKANDLLILLGEIGDPAGLDLLKEAVQSQSEAERLAAIEALSLWPDDVPFELLFGLAETGTQSSEGVLAIRGCVQLIEKATWSADEKAEKYQQLLNLEPDVASIRLILSRLPLHQSRLTLILIGMLMEDKRVQPEAELAMITALKEFYWLDRDAAEHYLSRLAVSENERIRIDSGKLMIQMKH